jgi:hypothetical protein
MRCFILIIAVISLAINSSGQEARKFFLDEFTFSINKTIVEDYNTENGLGFGFGVFHSFFPNNIANLVLGIEFNRLKQYKNYAFSGHMFDISDLTYISNCISIPIGSRFNIGKKTKFLIENGGFVDIPISSHRKGTMTYYHIVPNEEYNVITTTIDQKVGLIPSVGFYLGIGIRFPFSCVEMIIKTDYKHGINNMNSDPDFLYGRYIRLAIGIKLI